MDSEQREICFNQVLRQGSPEPFDFAQESLAEGLGTNGISMHEDNVRSP